MDVCLFNEVLRSYLASGGGVDTDLRHPIAEVPASTEIRPILSYSHCYGRTTLTALCVKGDAAPNR